MIKAIAFDLQFTLVTFSTEILGFSDKFTLSNWFKLFDEGFKEVLKYIKTKDIKFDEISTHGLVKEVAKNLPISSKLNALIKYRKEIKEIKKK